MFATRSLVSAVCYTGIPMELSIVYFVLIASLKFGCGVCPWYGLDLLSNLHRDITGGMFYLGPYVPSFPTYLGPIGL